MGPSCWRRSRWPGEPVSNRCQDTVGGHRAGWQHLQETGADLWRLFQRGTSRFLRDGFLIRSGDDGQAVPLLCRHQGAVLSSHRCAADMRPSCPPRRSVGRSGRRCRTGFGPAWRMRCWCQNSAKQCLHATENLRSDTVNVLISFALVLSHPTGSSVLGDCRPGSREDRKLAKHSEYFVEPRGNGDWVVRLPHAERASAVRSSQREAIARAKQLAIEGVVHVKQLNGKFRKA